MLILLVLNAHTICKEGLTFVKGFTRAMNYFKRIKYLDGKKPIVKAIFLPPILEGNDGVDRHSYPKKTIR